MTVVGPLAVSSTLHVVISARWPMQRTLPLRNGNHYEILSPAADSLARKYPLAATLLLRAMIDFALKQNRSKRYRHAARHLAECGSLAGAIRDFGDFEPHDRYSARLKDAHGRKTAFWSLVS